MCLPHPTFSGQQQVRKTSSDRSPSSGSPLWSLWSWIEYDALLGIYITIREWIGLILEFIQRRQRCEVVRRPLLEETNNRIRVQLPTVRPRNVIYTHPHYPNVHFRSDCPVLRGEEQLEVHYVCDTCSIMREEPPREENPQRCDVGERITDAGNSAKSAIRSCGWCLTTTTRLIHPTVPIGSPKERARAKALGPGPNQMPSQIRRQSLFRGTKQRAGGPPSTDSGQLRRSR